MTWATDHDASIENLRKVQGSLTVGLIMVPRVDFLTCSLNETAAEVKRRNTKDFSFMPVLDDHERIVGLHNAERWFKTDAPDTPVVKDFAPLSEENVIGADASIFDFILQADKYPTNLVISGNQIAGLVSLSDLQQLPVRAALFALITSLEMAMALAIKRKWPEPSDWMELLSEGRRKKLTTAIDEARSKDGFVSEIAFTQFHDKADIICKGKLLQTPRRAGKKDFTAIRELRDSVAHANRYAETPETAKRVCEIVRTINQIKDDLLKIIEDLTPER